MMQGMAFAQAGNFELVTFHGNRPAISLGAMASYAILGKVRARAGKLVWCRRCRRRSSSRAVIGGWARGLITGEGKKNDTNEQQRQFDQLHAKGSPKMSISNYECAEYSMARKHYWSHLRRDSAKPKRDSG